MARSVFKRWQYVLTLTIGMLPAALMAQQTGAVTGVVLDQVAKAISGATVTARMEGGAASAATTDGQGRFSITGLAPGAYTVETTAIGFARNTRLGVSVSTSAAQDISITMNVDAISQSVTVQESVSLAADLAPQGNTLDATSARTEISNTVIENFMAPVADFADE